MKIKDSLFTNFTTASFLPIRLGGGIVLFAHGAQRLFGWFGGSGLQGTGQFSAEHPGRKPGVLMAALAGGTEFIGGLLLMAGFLTRLAGISLAGRFSVDQKLSQS